MMFRQTIHAASENACLPGWLSSRSIWPLLNRCGLTAGLSRRAALDGLVEVPDPKGCVTYGTCWVVDRRRGLALTTPACR